MAYRFRLYPDAQQEQQFLAHCAHARYMWNLAVEQHQHWKPGRASAPGYSEQCRQLTEARAENGSRWTRLPRKSGRCAPFRLVSAVFTWPGTSALYARYIAGLIVSVRVGGAVSVCGPGGRPGPSLLLRSASCATVRAGR